MTQLMNLQTGYAEVNGARLYYEMAGAGESLVLLHAGVADRRMWDDQFQAFAQHYRVIRYDTRGYGNSTLGDGDATWIQDLDELLHALSIERTILLGCSQGGTAMIDFALEQPDMVNALVLVSATPSGYSFAGEMPSKLQAFVAAYQQHDLVQAAELAAQIWFDGPRRQPEQMDAALRARVRAMMRDVFATGAIDLTGAKSAKQPAVGRLTEIHAPTLILIGDQDDPSVLEAGEHLSSAIAGAKKVVIPNAAHLPNLEKSTVFNRNVLDFLQRRQKRS